MGQWDRGRLMRKRRATPLKKAAKTSPVSQSRKSYGEGVKLRPLSPVTGRSAQFGKAREGKKGILFFQPDPAQLNHHADTPWTINRPWGAFVKSGFKSKSEQIQFHNCRRTKQINAIKLMFLLIRMRHAITSPCS